MINNQLFDHQSIIISLDVDNTLVERLKIISLSGFKFIEINSQDASLLHSLLNQFPDLKIGVGNIISVQQLEECGQAGFHFTSSPGFLPAIAQTAAVYSLNYFPGIATLSEAMQVMALGYLQAKPYPASLAFCALLNKNFPTLRLFPSEIEADEIEHYFTLPAVTAVSVLNPVKKQISNLASLSYA